MQRTAPPAPEHSVAGTVSRRGDVQPWVSLVIRLVLATVMLVSGLTKISDLPASVRAVRAYELLPEALVPLAGYGLPVAELILAFLLAAGLLTRLSAVAFCTLMLVFLGGIISAWARGLSIDCGCFGGGGPIAPDQTQYLQDIVRDTALLLLAVLLVRWPRSRFALDGALGLYPQPHPDHSPGPEKETA